MDINEKKMDLLSLQINKWEHFSEYIKMVEKYIPYPKNESFYIPAQRRWKNISLAHHDSITGNERRAMDFLGKNRQLDTKRAGKGGDIVALDVDFYKK